MAAGGSSANIHLGPGRLYYAPLGTAEPATAIAALPSAWRVVGYTESGTQIEAEVTSESIMVAEELDPVLIVQTSRMTRLTVEMVEMAVSKLAFAMGGSATRVDDATAFDFPDPASVTGFMLVWDSHESPTDANNRRWIFRAVYPNGTITINRNKAPQKASMSASFMCAVPEGSTSPVRVIPGPNGRI
jgi:hypothetical protein